MSTSEPGRSTASTSPAPKRSPVAYGAVARAEVRTCLRPMISVKASTAPADRGFRGACMCDSSFDSVVERSDEHTSELQSRGHLVCRLLLEMQTRQSGPAQP